MKILCWLMIICLLAANFLYAQEDITITTYYPSPSGSYNELSANFFQADSIAVGDGNNPNIIGDGVINFIGRNSDPADVEGSLYYNTNLNTFLYFDGFLWKGLGGINNIHAHTTVDCLTDFSLNTKSLYASCDTGERLVACSGGSSGHYLIALLLFGVAGSWKVFPDFTNNSCRAIFMAPVCTASGQEQIVTAYCGR